MDSSTIVALTSEHAEGDLSTFSFRCRGESFDESNYAKIMTDNYHTIHHLVEYQPEDVRLITDIVKLQDEPFDDLGINIATYLLGRQARSEVQAVFSGDSGDELFGGHPVYEADKITHRVDKIPEFLLKPILSVSDYFELSKRLTISSQIFSLASELE